MAEKIYDIKLKFLYNKDKENLICNIKNKIKDMFEVFCKIKYIKLESVFSIWR